MADLNILALLTREFKIFAEFKILPFQNLEFKILAFENPEFKNLVFVTPEFTIFAGLKILAFPNPDFKTLADFEILPY